MNEVKNPKVRKPLIYYYMMALLIMLLLNTFLFPALLGRKEVEVDYSTFTCLLYTSEPTSLETVCFSIYSDISSRIIQSAEPKSCSASDLHSSVLPTPVGPKNRKEA